LPKSPINITDIVYKKKTKNKSRSCLKNNNNHISINYTIDEEKMHTIYDNNERLISNISNIWSNEDLDTSQKWLQTLMNIGFVLPMVFPEEDDYKNMMKMRDFLSGKTKKLPFRS
jgi:hypothetical protein